jgi:hypothetical protein
MQRPIPGTREVKDREFLYIESPGNESFKQLLRLTSDVCPSLHMPASGGAIEEKVRINLKDKSSFIAISYKGDIDSWRARFLKFCELTGRKYGFIADGRLSLSNGFSASLDELEADFQT